MSINKKSLISLLLSMSQSDQKIHSFEARFLMDVGAQMGLTKEDILEIERNPEAYPLDPPKSEQQRMQILYHLLFMMKMDGDVSKAEEQLTHEVGLKMGFRPEMVNAMIQLIKDHVNKDVPPENMLEILKRYLN